MIKVTAQHIRDDEVFTLDDEQIKETEEELHIIFSKLYERGMRSVTANDWTYVIIEQ